MALSEFVQNLKWAVIMAFLINNALGQISLRAENVTYSYDTAGHLTGVFYDGGQSITYVYDAAGNLLRRKITVIVDTDNDFMDDGFETANFGGLSRDGTADFDSDGQSDLAEFLAQTDPTNGSSLLRVSGGSSSGADSVTITWDAVSGKRYRLQYKDDLTNPQWFDLSGDITATGSSASKLDDSIMGLRQRFYRVILLP